MKLPIYQVDAFASEVFRGNPAAVVPLLEPLPDEVLQSIAIENNLSETAYYFTNTDGELEIRWFTPGCEVDLCGHATLATAFVYFTEGNPTAHEVTFQSRSGPLTVTRTRQVLTMNFPAQAIEACSVPPAQLFESLAIDSAGAKLYHAGPDYMLVLEAEGQIADLDPNFLLLKSVDCRGVMVTAPGKSPETDFVSRFFAPSCGIPEDPVTGSAHCSMAPYWAEQLGKKELRAIQISARSGAVDCRVAGDRVHLSGKAVAYLEGVISI